MWTVLALAMNEGKDISYKHLETVIDATALIATLESQGTLKI